MSDEYFASGRSRKQPSAADRYAQLPPFTREFLEGLKQDDVKTLNDTMAFMRWTKTTSWFLRWAAVTIVAVFLGIAAFGDAFIKVIGWVRAMFGGDP